MRKIAAFVVGGLLFAVVSPASAQGTAVGVWNDVGTSGNGRTKIVESGCTGSASTWTCHLSALAEQRASSPRQGTCTDTTVTVAGSSFAGPCRAAFGATVVMQKTGSPAVCNGASVMDGTEPVFQYTNTQGINLSMSNLTITVVNNLVTVSGETVDINGNTVQEVKGTFMINCRNNTHYGSWAGKFDYVF